MSKQMIKEMIDNYSVYMIDIMNSKDKLEAISKELNLDTRNCKSKTEIALAIKKTLS